MYVSKTKCGSGNLYEERDDMAVAIRVGVKTLAPTVDYPPYDATRAFYASQGFHLVDIIDPYPAWNPGNPCAIYLNILSPTG